MKQIGMVILCGALAACSAPLPKNGYVPCKRLGKMRQCVAVPLAPSQEDSQAKRFEAPAGKARIYLLRPFTQEPLTKSQVFVDGRLAADLAPLTYIVLDLSPGVHRIHVRTNVDAEAKVSVSEGIVYYIQYDLSLLFNTTTGRLKNMDAGSAQPTILKLKRAVTYGNE